jgi:lipopolysaccharide export system protein LptA
LKKSDNFIPSSIYLTTVLATVVWIGIFATDGVCAKPKATESEKSDKKEPIEVTADRMRSENKGDKIIFSGNVVATWGAMEITCDVMEVYNTPKKEGQKEEKSSADQVIAIGHVIMTKGTRKAKGDKAIYYDKTQQVVLTGSPNATAWEGDNQIEGKEMVFLLEEDRFLVKERVKMRLYSKKDKVDDKESNKEKDSKPAAKR